MVCDDLGPFHIYTVFQKTSTFLFFNNSVIYQPIVIIFWYTTVSRASETDQSSDSDTDNDNLTVKRKRKKGKALLNKKQPVKKTARTSGYMSEEL